MDLPPCVSNPHADSTRCWAWAAINLGWQIAYTSLVLIRWPGTVFSRTNGDDRCNLFSDVQRRMNGQMHLDLMFVPLRRASRCGKRGRTLPHLISEIHLTGVLEEWRVDQSILIWRERQDNQNSMFFSSHPARSQKNRQGAEEWTNDCTARRRPTTATSISRSKRAENGRADKETREHNNNNNNNRAPARRRLLHISRTALSILHRWVNFVLGCIFSCREIRKGTLKQKVQTRQGSRRGMSKGRGLHRTQRWSWRGNSPLDACYSQYRTDNLIAHRWSQG